MATITITNLYATGSELFVDSESYLNELTDEQMNLTVGGWLIPRPTIPNRPIWPIWPIRPWPPRPIMLR